MFSSKSFIVSGLTFRSLIHFEFIFAPLPHFEEEKKSACFLPDHKIQPLLPAGQKKKMVLRVQPSA